MQKIAPPDPTGWQAYCDNCEAFRDARLVTALDALNHRPYHEWICKMCASVLLTVKSAGEEQ